jgi:hypothetical protein
VEIDEEMSDIVERLRDMHASAADSCDPEYNRALLQAAAEIERLRAALREALELGDVAASAAGVVIRRALEGK